MSRFENKLCPVCRSRFNEKAEVVVCPICGTPHHRICYLTNNKCSLEDMHDSGWTWNGMLPDEEPEKATAEELSAVITNAVDPSEIDPHHAEYPEGTPTYDEEQRMFEEKLGEDNPFRELYRSLNDKEIGMDGVSMHELVAYSATSVYHYGRAFKAFRGSIDGKRHKVSVNFCSGLFAPIFQFYRRMNFFGVFALLLTLAPTFISVMMQDRITDANDPLFYSLDFARIVIMVLLCMFGDYFYYRHCVKSIVRFRRNYEGDTKSDEYFMALYELGKPTFAGAFMGALTMAFCQACLLALSKMI